MKERKSNIELLRIVAMLMIITAHMMFHGVLAEPVLNRFNETQFVAQLASIGGKVGVGIFVVVTGYFNVKKDKINFKSLGKLWGITFFYSTGLALLTYALGINEFKIAVFTKMLLPVITNQYWFVTYYMLLMFISPIINRLIMRLDKRIKIFLATIVMMVWFLLPTVSGLLLNKMIIVPHPFIVFVLYYVIGACIKLYGNSLVTSKKIYFTVGAVSVVGYIMGVVYFERLAIMNQSKYVWWMASQLSDSHSPFVLGMTISLFCIFLNLNIGYVKEINVVSASVVSVYLIHEHNFIRPLLWHRIFEFSGLLDKSFLSLILFTIVSVSMIFTLSFLIDRIRKIIIQAISDDVSTRESI